MDLFNCDVIMTRIWFEEESIKKFVEKLCSEFPTIRSSLWTNYARFENLAYSL